MSSARAEPGRGSEPGIPGEQLEKPRFSLEGTTLRPLEPEDVDTLYAWHLDLELEILSGWTRRWSRASFRQRLETLVGSPPEDLVVENLYRVYAQVYDFNRASMKVLEGLGFAAEGVLRQHELHNGERRDMHLYGMLKHEFRDRWGTRFAIPSDP